MFSSIQSIPGLIFTRSDVKAKIRPGVEANYIKADFPSPIAVQADGQCKLSDVKYSKYP